VKKTSSLARARQAVFVFFFTPSQGVDKSLCNSLLGVKAFVFFFTADGTEEKRQLACFVLLK